MNVYALSGRTDEVVGVGPCLRRGGVVRGRGDEAFDRTPPRPRFQGLHHNRPSFFIAPFTRQGQNNHSRSHVGRHKSSFCWASSESMGESGQDWDERTGTDWRDGLKREREEEGGHGWVETNVTSSKGKRILDAMGSFWAARNMIDHLTFRPRLLIHR